jgi:hypothetical protein
MDEDENLTLRDATSIRERFHSHTGWNHGKIVTDFNWDSSKWNTDPYFTGDRTKHGQILKSEHLNSGQSIINYKDQIKQEYKQKTLPLLILMRNPHDWLRSYNIKHNQKRVPWKTLAKSCQTWSEINTDYIDSDWPKKHIIKYEKLRDETLKQIDKISEFLNIPRNETFSDTGSDAVIMSRTDYKVGFDKTNGEEISIEEHQKRFGIKSEEYEKIFQENIDPKVLDFYHNL